MPDGLLLTSVAKQNPTFVRPVRARPHGLFKQADGSPRPVEVIHPG